MPVPFEASLEANFPELLKEWHTERNLPLSPATIAKASRTKVWWKCENDHEWKISPDQRYKNGKIVGNCKVCKSIDFVRNDLVKHISDKNNDKDLHTMSIESPKKIIWSCENGHTFEREIRDAAKRDNLYCVKCSSLGWKFPELLKEFDFKKNQNVDPYSISANSNKKIWWKCKNDHQWEQQIMNRTLYYPNKKSECKVCRSVGFNRPDLIKEWDFEKNKLLGLDPYQITLSSDIRVGWVCAKGHKWEGSAYSRTRVDYNKKNMGGCKICNSKI